MKRFIQRSVAGIQDVSYFRTCLHHEMEASRCQRSRSFCPERSVLLLHALGYLKKAGVRSLQLLALLNSAGVEETDAYRRAQS